MNELVGRPESSIDIDIGGTFTDCYVTRGDQQVISKTPTTGYNPYRWVSCERSSRPPISSTSHSLICSGRPT